MDRVWDTSKHPPKPLVTRVKSRSPDVTRSKDQDVNSRFVWYDTYFQVGFSFIMQKMTLNHFLKGKIGKKRNSKNAEITWNNVKKALLTFIMAKLSHFSRHQFEILYTYSLTSVILHISRFFENSNFSSKVLENVEKLFPKFHAVSNFLSLNSTSEIAV